MRFVSFAWLMLAGLTPSLAVAQTLDSGLERFKAELVKTYNNPDPERIRTLMHPISLACLQAEPKYERYQTLSTTTLKINKKTAVVVLDNTSRLLLLSPTWMPR